jgi:hypothetical protein
VTSSNAQNLSRAESETNTVPGILVYAATIDFPNINAGEVPYYKDDARNALAIDASVVSYRDKFARATASFTGTAGNYDVTITALGETDGDCFYRLLVNGNVMGTRQNTPVTVDYTPQNHTFTNVAIPAGATLGVESNAVSNGLIPEAGGFAFARGRWTTLALAPAAPPDEAVSLTLIDAETDSDLGPLLPGTVINLASLSSPDKALNVRANANPPTVGSVRFGYDANPNFSTDDMTPYAFAGDVAGNYNAWTPTVGAHSITATPWSGAGATGTQGLATTVDFTVIDSPTAPAVTRLVLVNAATDQDLFDLSDGMQINLASLPTTDLNVRAVTSPTTVGSVVFGYNGNSSYIIESVAPYAIGGDISGNYSTWPAIITLGSHRILATPWSATGGGGNPGSSLGVNVTVVNQAVTDPIVDAGANQTILLPANSATFTAIASDDGPIQSYAWTQISGPSTATVSGESTPHLTAGALVEGIYVFRITVTDLDGYSATDEVAVSVITPGTGEVTVTGELKKWHKLTLVCSGPATDEKATPNPFMDYRLNATFTHPASGKAYIVPGYYAADGNAANTSATAGNKWHVHFSPDETGDWNYALSFRAGTAIALDPSPASGTSASFFDNNVGSFNIAATDKTGRDNRAMGRLQYVGKHHLRYAETGGYFLKAGVDSPENLLAYEDFDDTPNDQKNQPNLRKTWAPHAADYDPAEASAFTWSGGRGTGLLGAVRYLSDKGLNVFSFLTFSLDGDDDNVFPHLLTSTTAEYEAIADNARWESSAIHKDRFDVSKMAQWENVFSYAETKGMYLHFKTQETENDQRMDGGALGNERKLYYRELLARFGHHLALNWNLGEENRNTDADRKSFAKWFHDNDPYRHNVVLHTFPNEKDVVYTPLLGNGSKLTGVSLQGSQASFTDIFGDTLTWVTNSANSGSPWVVAYDEPGDAQAALRPVGNPGNSWTDGRKNALWGNVMAGGAGVEFYFGYGYADSDLTCQNFRSRDGFWDYCRHMLAFFRDNGVPFQDMKNENVLSSNSDSWCLRKPGEAYVVYLKNGGTTNLNLTAAAGQFAVSWFDPRNGGALQLGSVSTVMGGSIVSLGSAPNSSTSDWVVYLSGGSAVPDTFPPSPNPSSFLMPPAAFDGTTIMMTATTATDPSGPVEYYFENTSGGGNDSDWQTTAFYQDLGLTPGVSYAYRVKTRDSLHNETDWSSALAASAAPDTTAPAPDPMGFASPPTIIAGSSITMTATTATDPTGVEYYFENTAGGGNDSGWQDSPSFTITGAVSGITYSYRVRARDKSANQNTTAFSDIASVIMPVSELLAHYTFDTSNGTTTPDSAPGSSASATLNSLAINTSPGIPKAGTGALEMSGTATGAVTSNTFSWSASDVRSIAFWWRAKAPNTDTIQGTYISMGGSGTVNYGRFDLRENGVPNTSTLRLETQGASISPNPAIDDGAWHFITVIVPNETSTLGDVRAYVDGDTGTDLFAGNTSATSINTITSALVFGGSVLGGRVPHGYLDDFQMYGGVLTPEQIQFLYQNPGLTLAGLANSYSNWIGSFNLPADQRGFTDDSDRDGLANGVEAWFGTHPGEFSPGIVLIQSDGTTTTFQHPLNPDPPSGTTGTYEWSSNLIDWYSTGSGPAGGAVVTITPQSAGTVVTVTVTSSQPSQRVFLRAEVRDDG